MSIYIKPFCSFLSESVSSLLTAISGCLVICAVFWSYVKVSALGANDSPWLSKPDFDLRTVSTVTTASLAAATNSDL